MARRALTLPVVVLAACTASGPPIAPPAPPPAPPAAPREDPCQEARAAQARVPALLAAGQLDRTVRVLRRAAERCPAAAPQGRANLVRALARVGRSGEARAEIAAIEADARVSAEVKSAAAEAKALLAAIAATGPSAGDLARLLAEADTALAQGLANTDRDKLERARALYLEAAAGPAPDGDALYGAGRAERALGEAAAAQALFDRAVVALEARAGAVAHADGAAEASGSVVSAAWSRGADRLAIARAGGVTVFDVRTLREHGHLEGEPDEVAFAGSDGARLAVARKGRIEIFDVRTLQKVRTIEVACAVMAASPRAPKVVCAAPEGKVTMVDLDHDGAGRALADLGGAPLQLRFSDDGKSLIALTAQSLSLWDVERGKRARAINARRGSELRDLWPLRDGRTFALAQAPLGAEITEVDRVDRASLAARGRLPIAKAEEDRAPPPNVNEPGIWSDDGRHYLVRSDGSVRDRAGARVPLGGPPARAVLSAGFSGDGKVLGAGYEGGVFRSFDADTGKVRRTYVQTWETRVLAFRVDRGEYIARVASSPRTAWSADGRMEVRAHRQLVIVRNAKDEKVCEGEGGKDEIVAVAMSPDGGEVVTLSPTEALFWDAARCTVTAALPGVPGSHPVAAAFTPEGDGVVIAWRGAREELRAVDLASRTDRLIGPIEGARRLFFPPGGRSVALADPLRIWDLETAKPVEHGAVRGSVLALSRDGKVAVSTEGHDGALLFSQIQTGQLLVGLRALGDGATAYAFVEGAAPADVRVEPLDDKAREALVCRVGPRAYPFELCAERSEVSGLFTRAMRQERTLLDP